MIEEFGSTPIDALVEIMRRLRDPEGGCPWDIEQSFETIAPYTIEEAYEVADAIHRGSREELRGELGDLLLQVIYHSRMAEEEGSFAFNDVARGIAEKMVRRHPHVFGNETIETAEAQVANWEAVKAAERAATPDPSALAGVAVALPALVRAQKLQRRAARVGFDWPDPSGVIEKIAEEAGELSEAKAQGASEAHVAEEYGDLLFTVAVLGQWLGVDGEEALAAANRKFERRFRAVEAALTDSGKVPQDSTLAEMDALWDAVKRAEKSGGAAPDAVVTAASEGQTARHERRDRKIDPRTLRIPRASHDRTAPRDRAGAGGGGRPSGCRGALCPRLGGRSRHLAGDGLPDGEAVRRGGDSRTPRLPRRPRPLRGCRAGPPRSPDRPHDRRDRRIRRRGNRAPAAEDRRPPRLSPHRAPAGTLRGAEEGLGAVCGVLGGLVVWRNTERSAQMTVKQTTSYTDQAFAHAQALVDSGEFPNISAAVSGVLVRDRQRREQEALHLKAELDRRSALPADQWEDWTPGAVFDEYRWDRAAVRDD